MANQEPVVLNGRYELHRRIARGGMAEVVLARDQLLDRPVAVKILFPEFATDAAFVERFRREAQAAANLNHPNIVGVYDWGREANTYFIVMEYVDGRSLADILRAEGTLHPNKAADIATDVAAALGFAHRNGVVHRDVKPGNVLISSAGLVKVTDFGIARAITSNGEEALTQTGSVMGTATYFSPEQAQGKHVDPRSDLYSLGIVMYEMVCGEAPFRADNPVAVAYKHVQEQVVPPSQLNPAVPADYEAITMKLLAKSPSGRYATAEDLRADLRRFREGQPVHAAGAPTGVLAATGAMTAVSPTLEHTPPKGTMPAYDPYGAEPAGRSSKRFAIALVAVLVAVGLLVFLFYRTIGAGGGEVTVPDVAGQSATAAIAALQDKGFSYHTQLTPSEKVPNNVVIGTKPPAGDKAKKGSFVTILVSSGPPVIIPGVIGKSVQEATDLLVNANVPVANIKQTAVYRDGCKVGSVLATNPAPKSPVGANGIVTLSVCQGAKTRVPTGLAGATVSAAQTALQQAGYQTLQNYQASGSVANGQVIGTTPPGGSRLSQGETVTILVSSGPPSTTTPPPPTTAVPNTTQPPPTTEPPRTSPPNTTSPPTTAAP